MLSQKTLQEIYGVPVQLPVPWYGLDMARVFRCGSVSSITTITDVGPISYHIQRRCTSHAVLNGTITTSDAASSEASPGVAESWGRRVLGFAESWCPPRSHSVAESWARRVLVSLGSQSPGVADLGGALVPSSAAPPHGCGVTQRCGASCVTGATCVARHRNPRVARHDAARLARHGRVAGVRGPRATGASRVTGAACGGRRHRLDEH